MEPLKLPYGETQQGKTMSTLNEFISIIKTQGLARTNRFSISIASPIIDEDIRTIHILCDSVSMPGISLNTTEQKIYGEVRELPIQPVYEPITFTFYVDTNMGVKNMFEKWINLIRDPRSRSFNYYSNYVVDTEIYVHRIDSDEDIVHKVTLYESYPKSLSAIQLDYGSKDVMKYSVTMNYKWYETASTAATQSTLETYNQDPLKINTGVGFTPDIGEGGNIPNIF